MLFRPSTLLARRAILSKRTPISTTTHHQHFLRHPPTRFLSTSPFRLSSPMAAETDSEAATVASSSDITPDSLSATLKQKIGATYVSIEDMSGGCGQAFNAIIVSPEFEKKNLLARHRLVNNALKQEIAAIHAWTPKCLTPEQWETEKVKLGMS